MHTDNTFSLENYNTHKLRSFGSGAILHFTGLGEMHRGKAGDNPIYQPLHSGRI